MGQKLKPIDIKHSGEDTVKLCALRLSKNDKNKRQWYKKKEKENNQSKQTKENSLKQFMPLATT